MSFELGLDILMGLTALSLIICFRRLYIGPTASNRAAAFDLIAVHAAGLIVLYAIRFGQQVLLDAAIITAVLGFLGTVLFARYIEESPNPDKDR